VGAGCSTASIAPTGDSIGTFAPWRKLPLRLRPHPRSIRSTIRRSGRSRCRRRPGFPVAAPDPVAIEELADGSVLILDGSASGAPVGDSVTASMVYRYRLGSQLGQPLALSGVVDIADTSANGATRKTLAVIAHDIAFNRDANILHAVDRFGRQSLGFLVAVVPSLSLELQPTYLPMHRYGGRALVAWREQARLPCPTM